MERAPESKSNTVLILILVAAVSCSLRFLGLGGASLTMNEAQNAVDALSLTGIRNGQLLYVLPTAVLFRIFGSSEFTARLFPALTGTLLTLVPLFFQKRIGSRKAVLFSFLLAVDPVLLFWSKRADAVIPAMAFLAIAMALLAGGKHTAGLTCFLIALCGGERAWPAVIITMVCAAAAFFLFKYDLRSLFPGGIGKGDLLKALFFAALLCVAFGWYPGGINGFAAGIVNSLKPGPSWAYPGLTAELMAAGLYCGIPLTFCVVHSIRYDRIPALLISLAAAVLLLLWQGIVMLPWVSLFLWYGALESVFELYQRLRGSVDFPFFMSAFVISGAYSFFYFRMVELFSQRDGNEPVTVTWNGTEQTLPLTRFGGAMLLTVVSILILALVVKILMGFVNSLSIRRGIICGFLVILSWGAATGIWNAGGFDREGDHPLALHPKNTACILNGAYTSYTNTAFFELFSEMMAKHGNKMNPRYGLNFITGDPMMDWFLRNYPGITTTANIQSDLTGVELMIGPSGASFESAGYVHSQHNWRGTMDWSRFSFQDWGKWLVFGDGGVTPEAPVSLWARADNIIFSE